MARPFSELTKDFPPERRARVDAQANALIKEYRLLKALRQDLNLSQAQLAELMGIRQASVSKLENQGDMQLSTLRKYVHALGGELEINVRFEDHAVNITGLVETS